MGSSTERHADLAQRLARIEARRTGKPEYGEAARLAFEALLEDALLPASVGETDAGRTVFLQWFHRECEQRVPLPGTDADRLKMVAADWGGRKADLLMRQYERALLTAYSMVPAAHSASSAHGPDEAAAEPSRKGGAPILLCNYWAYAETLLGRTPDLAEYERLHNMEKGDDPKDALIDVKKSLDAGIKTLRSRYKKLQETDS